MISRIAGGALTSLILCSLMVGCETSTRTDPVEAVAAVQSVVQPLSAEAEALRQRAEQGDAWAQNRLGWMYREGEGVPQDDRQAVFWFRKAAERGDPKAQSGLAIMYDEGRGVRLDDAQAAVWYRRAAEQGFAVAQSSLGLMYEWGEGVPQDDAEAVFWYRKSAEQESAGQLNPGLSWVHRDGVR